MGEAHRTQTEPRSPASFPLTNVRRAAEYVNVEKIGVDNDVAEVDQAHMHLEEITRRGLRDEAGDLRVIVKWPDPEVLIASVFNAVDTYGLEHPLVIDAALRLARRLSAAAEESSMVTALDAAMARLDAQAR